MKKLFCFILIVVFINSCQKDNQFDSLDGVKKDITSTLSGDQNGDKILQGGDKPLRDEKVIEKLKSYFSSRKEVREKLETEFGNPIWDVAFTNLENDDPYVMLPFGFDGEEELSGILIAFYAKNKSDWGFYMLTKDGIDDVKSAKDIPKKANGKREELSRELYAGLFVNFEGYLFGKVDCEMLELLGIESNSSSRDYSCNYNLTIIEQCWHMFAGYISPSTYLYSECTYSYDYYEYCYEHNYIGASEEDNPGPDDDVDPNGGPGDPDPEPEKLINSKGEPYNIRPNGTVRFTDLPKLYIQNESKDKIASHIFNVVYQTQILFCDTGRYYPIDWSDYLGGRSDFFHGSFGSCQFVVKWNTNYGGTVMDTDPRESGTDKYVLSWTSVSSSYDQILQVTADFGYCANRLIGTLAIDCNDIR